MDRVAAAALLVILLVLFVWPYLRAAASYRLIEPSPGPPGT